MALPVAGCLFRGGQAVSDTPRTDAEAFLPHDSKYRVCDADFVRQLERELNAANERIKRLEEAGNRAIENSYYPDRVKVWNKAKEAKP
jgi:hypothetical protein